MMVIYVPFKLTKMWTDRRMDRQTDKKRTNRQTDGITPISKGT